MPRKSKNKAAVAGGAAASGGGRQAALAHARPAAAAAAAAAPPSLFGDGGSDGSSSDGDGGALRVNRRFAQDYETRKQAQELSRAQELGLLDGAGAGAGAPDSEDEVSEDEGEQLTSGVDRKILATIAALRRRDPAVYDPARTFFPRAEPAESGDGGGEDDAAAAAQRPAGSAATKRRVTAKDVLRQQLLEAAARGETDAFGHDAEDDVGGPRARLEDGDRNPKVYDAEQAALRQAFLESAAGGDDDDGDDEGGMTLSVKQRPQRGGGARKATSATDGVSGDDEGGEGEDGAALGVATVDRDTLREFLRAKAGTTAAASAAKDRKAPGGAASSRTTSSAAVPRGLAQHADELADPDAFLDAFMRSRVWEEEEGDDDDDDDDDDFGVRRGPQPVDGAAVGAAPGDEPEERDGAASRSGPPKSVSWFGGGGGGGGAVIDELDADGADVERADAFEAAYNFRFEEPGGGVIATHARSVEGSLRRKDPKRKEERERRRERKEEERSAAEADTRRLMNLKRAQLKGRMVRIRDTAGAGVDMDTLARVLGDDLDADWDPAAYDARMAALFGDDYYAQGEEASGLAAAAAAAGGRGKAAAAGGGGGGAGTDDDDDGDGDGDDDGDNEGVAPWVYGDGPRPAWAGPSAEELAAGVDDGFGDVGETEEEEQEEEEQEAVDEQQQQQQEEEADEAVTGRSRAGKRGRKAARGKPSAVARAKAMLAREVAGLGSVEDSDEVLALGFEDVIAGGLRTRFSYMPVPAGDFGLSTEEILLADDAALNSFLGLRRLAPYREVPWVMPPKARKRALGDLRARLRADLLARAPELVAAEHAPAPASGEAAPMGSVSEAAREAASTAASAASVDGDDGAPASAAEGNDGAGGDKKKRRRRKHKAAGAAAAESSQAAPASESAGPATYVTNSFQPVRPTAGHGEPPQARPAKADKGALVGKEKKRGHRAANDEDSTALVTLPSGGQIKKARLATYDGL